MERRSEPASAPPVATPRSGTVVDARMSLALWLRAGRSQRGMSLDDVARVTKIQTRILERLEAGKLDGLPADVFVRGFVRSFAKCVGLDEAEALRRYRDAASQPSAPAARALVESMSELAPVTARASSTRLPTSGGITTAPVTTGAPAQVEAAHPAIETASETASETAPAPTSAGEARAEDVTAAPASRTGDTAQSAQRAQSAQASTQGSKRKKKNRGKGRKRKTLAVGTPSGATPIVATSDASHEVATEATSRPATEPRIEPTTGPTTGPTIEPTPEVTVDARIEASAEEAREPGVPVDTSSTASAEPDVSAPAEPWTPRMPTVVAPTVPWRRPAYPVRHTAPARVVPSLVIDDADPELAEREREDRAAAKEPTRRMFLPPILLDREDRSARQGGLTLAVIILLIAATLTLSYLMRRPSSSGDGVTQAPPAAHVETEQLA